MNSGQKLISSGFNCIPWDDFDNKFGRYFIASIIMRRISVLLSTTTLTLIIMATG